MLWFHSVWWITRLHWREGASSESLLHSLPPQHETFPPILHSNNPGCWNGSLWGIRKGHLRSLAWRDHKRSYYLSASPEQDADAAADKFLSNEFLKTSATSPGMSHNISTSLHVSLLSVKTITSCAISSKHKNRFSVFFSSWFFYVVFLTTLVTSQKHQDISSSQRFFPVTIAVISKHSWSTFLKKKSESCCGLYLWFYFSGCVFTQSFLLLLRDDVGVARTLSSFSGRPWQHLQQKTDFKRKEFPLLSEETVFPITPKLQQFQATTQLQAPSNNSSFSSSLFSQGNLLRWGWSSIETKLGSYTLILHK